MELPDGTKERSPKNNTGKMQNEAESQEELEDAFKKGFREIREQARLGTGSCCVP